MEDAGPQESSHGDHDDVVRVRDEVESQRMSCEKRERQAQEIQHDQEGADQPIVPQRARSDVQACGAVDGLAVGTVDDGGEIDRALILDVGDHDDVAQCPGTSFVKSHRSILYVSMSCERRPVP